MKMMKSLYYLLVGYVMCVFNKSMSFDVNEKVDYTVQYYRGNDLTCYECQNCTLNANSSINQNTMNYRVNCKSCFIKKLINESEAATMPNAVEYYQLGCNTYLECCRDENELKKFCCQSKCNSIEGYNTLPKNKFSCKFYVYLSFAPVFCYASITMFFVTVILTVYFKKRRSNDDYLQMNMKSDNFPG